MSSAEAQEQEFQKALRGARILTLALGVGAPLSYLVVLVVAALGGNPRLLLAGFSDLPWANPLLPVFLMLSASTLGLSFVLPNILAKRQESDPFGLLRTRLILRCALMESAAIFGLVLSFVLGPAAATLSLLLILVPLVGTVLVFPNEAEWRGGR